AGHRADIGKESAGFVAVQREGFLVDVGDKEILPPIAGHIRGVHAHSRARFAVLAIGDAVFEPSFLKGLSLTVDEQEVLQRIIGLKNVEEAIVINIRCHSSKALTEGVCNSCRTAHVCELTVSVVVEQPARPRIEDPWNAVISITLVFPVLATAAICEICSAYL